MRRVLLFDRVCGGMMGTPSHLCHSVHHFLYIRLTDLVTFMGEQKIHNNNSSSNRSKYAISTKQSREHAQCCGFVKQQQEKKNSDKQYVHYARLKLVLVKRTKCRCIKEHTCWENVFKHGE